MTMQLPNEAEIHQAIIVAFSEAAWEEAEKSAGNAAWLAEFNAAVKSLAPFASDDVVRTLENAPWRMGQRFGEAMFQLGVMVGKNPYALVPKVPPTEEGKP